MDLTGKLLIAMPDMTDPRFAQSLVFLCSHNKDGAMGLVVNKPASEISLGDILGQLEIGPCTDEAASLAIHFGGPVDSARGFVLHSTDYTSNLQTLHVDESFSMTATLDVLEDLAHDRGPSQALLALGYAGWGPGQLESEIARNGWLTVQADKELVFDTPDKDKWRAALDRLGVSPLVLSSTAGRA